MDIKKIENNGEIIFEISGRIDTNTSPELEKAVSEIINDSNSIVFDFKGVEYISSAGLRVLLMTHKTMSKKGGFTVTNPATDIMEIFEVTGFSDILNIKG